MKILRMSALIVLIILMGQAAWAQCPSAMGTWTTEDGTMLPGRASEAWCGGYPGQPGNTENAMSWDGVSLGTQWRAWGMAIDAVGATLIHDGVVGGDGFQIYSTNYDGGQFWLTKDHTWSNGVDDLTGDLTSFNVTTTITYEGGVHTGAVSNIVFTGMFVDCPELNDCEITFSISNAINAWHPDMGGDFPADYPDLLCGANTGEAFNICCIELNIACAVDTEDSSWGSVKALYK